MSSYDIHIEGREINETILMRVTDLIAACVDSGTEFTFSLDPELAEAVNTAGPFKAGCVDSGGHLSAGSFTQGDGPIFGGHSKANL